MPPLVTVSAALLSTKTLSKSGRNFRKACPAWGREKRVQMDCNYVPSVGTQLRPQQALTATRSKRPKRTRKPGCAFRNILECCTLYKPNAISIPCLPCVCVGEGSSWLISNRTTLDHNLGQLQGQTFSFFSCLFLIPVRWGEKYPLLS